MEDAAVLLRITRDHTRFRSIVRGKIRKDFKKFITHSELLGRRGKHIITIPVPEISIPTFRYGRNQGGLGQGEGRPGDPAPGAGEAGDQPGAHILEAEVTLDELAALLGEELELPRIRPRGHEEIQEQKDRYTSIRSTGPESLRHFRRTYRRALKRVIASGRYNPEHPIIYPIKEDKLYKSWTTTQHPRTNAVIFYLMDVSGSMGEEQKETVRTQAFWIDTWLQHNYRDIKTRYVVHDAEAHEVDRETFYHLREAGGTKISSAYSLLAEILAAEFPPQEWNIYAFHFSDGDNWGTGDTDLCLEILAETILPDVNLFGYAQVESPYGSGQFIHDLKAKFVDTENLVASHVAGKDGVYDSIKEFLGKGR
jgi:uncharacterized sporulation protein YeaH/YhbH (DUF444 family)